MQPLTLIECTIVTLGLLGVVLAFIGVEEYITALDNQAGTTGPRRMIAIAVLMVLAAVGLLIHTMP